MDYTKFKIAIIRILFRRYLDKTNRTGKEIKSDIPDLVKDLFGKQGVINVVNGKGIGYKLSVDIIKIISDK
jgi:hypothetical protein